MSSTASLHQITPSRKYQLHFKNNTHGLHKYLWMAKTGLQQEYQDNPLNISTASRWVIGNPNLQQ